MQHLLGKTYGLLCHNWAMVSDSFVYGKPRAVDDMVSVFWGWHFKSSVCVCWIIIGNDATVGNYRTRNIYNVTIYKTLKWAERATLKLPLATETLIWLNIIGWFGGSLLKFNYCDEYLACKQEVFCERYIRFKGNWELLSVERLGVLLKSAQLQLNGTWEAKPVLKYESSCFRK